ncbi:BQ5605_C033g11197 [Microbotryum silenes-dioicae]|uniref:BQ5605_C033g11197 protein n=1 Tax=Microbotryum silenes-dioicae TaxID=796604 RepID=A0A2X0MGZ6_9BASI|nr:BQ5605_C033g11197 [Microbotryum silenes-dioicae]
MKASLLSLVGLAFANTVVQGRVNSPPPPFPLPPCLVRCATNYIACVQPCKPPSDEKCRTHCDNVYVSL